MKYILLFILFFSSFVAVQAQRYEGDQETSERYPYCTGLFCHVDGTVFNMDDEINSQSAVSYMNILNWLQGRVAGLQVYQTRNGPVAFIRNRPAAVFIDEMRVDISFLDLLPVTDIAVVKVMKEPFAVSAPGGVIAIYTKRGDSVEEEE